MTRATREYLAMEASFMIDPITVRISTATKLTGLGRSKIYQLIAAGELDVIKIGTATLIPMSSLENMMDRHKR